MIKVVLCLRRLPTLSPAEFYRYWLGNHGPLVHSHATTLRIRRYTQGHTLTDARVEPAVQARGCQIPAFDGVAEVYWNSIEELIDAASTKEGRAAGRALLEDERRFIDLANSSMFYAREHDLVPGPWLPSTSPPGPSLRPVGYVESALADLAAAPCQGDEGAPDSWLVFEADMCAALEGVRPGDDIVVVTWLHLADRTIRQVHPRGDPNRPRQGVFATRSPDRPNPLGLHVVKVLTIDGLRVQVRGLEAIDKTPIVDVKPVLEPRGQR